VTAFDLGPFEIDLDKLTGLPPDQLEEAMAHIQALKRGLQANPMWTIMPHLGEHGRKLAEGLPLTGRESRGQVEFLECTPRGVFHAAVVAGNRFGKTQINVIEAAIQTLPRAFIPPWLLPYKTLDPEKRDIRGRFIGPDKDRWVGRAVVPKMRLLLPPDALLGGSFDKAWKVREGILTFADGSWWDFLTHDMELDAFSSVELDFARFDEEPTGAAGERIYDETIRGLVDRAGYIRSTLTPVEGIGWLHGELADENGEPRKDDESYVVTGSIDDNPHISDKGREQAKRRWAKDPATYAARASGVWTHREGLIFPEFKRYPEQPPGGEQEGGHIRADRPLRNPYGPSPRDPETGQWLVPVFEALDPGINVDHPFAFTIAFLNTGTTDVHGMDDVLEVFFAFKAPNLDVTQQAAVVHEARARFGYRPSLTKIDPSAQNRNPETGRRLIDAWRKEGIYPTPGQNDRALTYAEIRGRLNTHRYRIWGSCDAVSVTSSRTTGGASPGVSPRTSRRPNRSNATTTASTRSATWSWRSRRGAATAPAWTSRSRPATRARPDQAAHSSAHQPRQARQDRRRLAVAADDARTLTRPMAPERIHIAEPPPPRCSGCFAPPTAEKLPFVDLGAAWDGPSIPALEGTVGVIAHHIDDLILCSECVRNAARLLGLDDVTKLRGVITERDATIERHAGAARRDASQGRRARGRTDRERGARAVRAAAGRSRQPRAKATA
jgi:hypothetical protein